MVIRTRFSIGADGYATRPDGWPSLLADPTFVPGKSHGWPKFQASCETVLTATVSLDTKLTLEEVRPLPEGALDIVYGVA
jgi:hypothetical protein